MGKQVFFREDPVFPIFVQYVSGHQAQITVPCSEMEMITLGKSGGQHSCCGMSCLHLALPMYSQRCLLHEAILHSGHFGASATLCCNLGRRRRARHVLVH